MFLLSRKRERLPRILECQDQEMVSKPRASKLPSHHSIPQNIAMERLDNVGHAAVRELGEVTQSYH